MQGGKSQCKSLFSWSKRTLYISQCCSFLCFLQCLLRSSYWGPTQPLLMFNLNTSFQTTLLKQTVLNGEDKTKEHWNSNSVVNLTFKERELFFHEYQLNEELYIKYIQTTGLIKLWYIFPRGNKTYWQKKIVLQTKEG